MGARFVRLGIAGFKSFADPVTLDILPGLTGVVGPNGCGKSNVAEALRWAMGEANARHLRGGEMDDVIFAGSAHRPARNLAEVSLQLESDDTGLPPPYGAQSELQVVRRIERGGGSAYRVDGREARARDVQTLFADLASGARSSAMVSQGRVGALVNARPEERRALLEEAAGITGLHARRAEAEMRLRATETNLERAEERRALLEQQLAALQVQARQAARYRAVVDSAAETEAGLLAIGLARATAAHDAAVRDLEAAQSDLAQAQVAALSDRAAAERAKAAVPALREVEAETRTTFERARLAADGAAAEAARAREALAAAAARHSQLAHDLHHAETVLSDADAADARLVTEAERLRGEADAYPALLTQARREAEHATTTLLAADETATAAAAQAAEANAQAGALRQRLDEATQRARRADETRTRLDGERAKALARVVDDGRAAHHARRAHRSRRHPPGGPPDAGASGSRAHPRLACRGGRPGGLRKAGCGPAPMRRGNLRPGRSARGQGRGALAAHGGPAARPGRDGSGAGCRVGRGTGRGRRSVGIASLATASCPPPGRHAGPTAGCGGLRPRADGPRLGRHRPGRLRCRGRCRSTGVAAGPMPGLRRRGGLAVGRLHRPCRHADRGRGPPAPAQPAR